MTCTEKIEQIVTKWSTWRSIIAWSRKSEQTWQRLGLILIR